MKNLKGDDMTHEDLMLRLRFLEECRITDLKELDRLRKLVDYWYNIAECH